MSTWMAILIGVVIGWVTKVPVLIKWYNELKATKDYQKAMRYKRYLRAIKTNKSNHE